VYADAGFKDLRFEEKGEKAKVSFGLTGPKQKDAYQIILW
jgi:hypothetical protein